METKERQMTIDDYLNRDQVAVMPTGTTVDLLKEKESCEVIKPEPVDYNTLNKEDLIRIIETKNKDINNYEDKISKDIELHKIEIENLNHFYTQRTNELSNLVSYYERKLKVLGDIINMETGGVK